MMKPGKGKGAPKRKTPAGGTAGAKARNFRRGAKPSNTTAVETPATRFRRYVVDANLLIVAFVLTGQASGRVS